jgi:hypothetical protein
MADIKISQLSEAQIVGSTDVFPITSNGVTMKTPASAIKDFVIGIVDNSELGTDVSTQIQTIASQVAKCETLVVNVPSFSALPQTIANSNIDDDMVVVNSVLSNSSAQNGDWTVTTSNGSLTISGSISGTTTATLYLMKSR